MIHYKFKSSLEYDTITFDGAGLPVWELKKEIVALKKLGSFHDFDLVITNAQTGEDYTDEYQMVPKNSSVVVRRVPMSSASQAQRARHVPMAAAPSRPADQSASGRRESSGANVGTEQEKIHTMLSQTGAHWNQASEQMAEQQQLSHNSAQIKRFIPKRTFLNPTVAARVPPPSYTCFRCGQKGHYIGACPTNDDPNFNPPRIKRTTGIPKTFLRPVDSVDQDENVMITGDGTLVSVAPNQLVWNQMTMARSALSDAEFLASLPAHLKCPVCNGIMREAMEMPCCGSSYCDECIRDLLLGEGKQEHEFECPNCHKSPIYPDTLLPNKLARQEIDELVKRANISKLSAALRHERGEAEGKGEGETADANAVDKASTQPLAGDGCNAKGDLQNKDQSYHLEQATEHGEGRPSDARFAMPHREQRDRERRMERPRDREEMGRSEGTRHRRDSDARDRSRDSEHSSHGRHSRRSPSPSDSRHRSNRYRSRSRDISDRHSHGSSRHYRR